jgi:hypothetical protein
MNAHDQELRRIALRIALDLATMNRHDALAVVEMTRGLIDHFVHPILGRNDLALADLERVAICQGRG